MPLLQMVVAQRCTLPTASPQEQLGLIRISAESSQGRLETIIVSADLSA
jgi:hypothetical protein